MSRRPSVTIYDYPEDLNPFKDDNEEVPVKYPLTTELSTAKDLVKDDKKKFWTFGRKKKQRSQSFSIKSTWNGLFGKKKEAVVERKPTIATVSTAYQRASYNDYPVAPPPRPSRDHQEFNEALGTLARRRKYTLDNSSRYGSSLTMNGDPGRIYDGSPQDTTASIMGDLTPKPPARRFGQVSPKPTDEIPPLDYGKREEGTPIPPKRGGFRSSQRLNPPEDDVVQLRHGNFTDENENEEFVFKRCSQDAVRKSNLSINSCVSVGSVYASGRKKRRAPPPPVKKAEILPPPKEDETVAAEPLEIARVTEDISEMTKRTQELDLSTVANKEAEKTMNGEVLAKLTEGETKEAERCKQMLDDKLVESEGEKLEIMDEMQQNGGEENKMADNEDTTKNSEIIPNNEIKPSEVIEVDIEYSRLPEEPLEIKKDVTIDDDLILRRPTSTSSLPGGENFSVKEEIEKIEKQIQMLESRKSRTRTTSYTLSLDDEDEHLTQFQRGGSRRSLQETRRHFFRDLTSKDDLQIEIKQLPRQQSNIEIVRLSDQPVVGEDTVQVIELHISEPIRKKVDVEINPIPKPRRCGAAQVSDNSENDSN